MAKSKTIFVCQSCGAKSPKWIGKCPTCSEWNTYTEEIIASSKQPALNTNYSTNQFPQLIKDLPENQTERISACFSEFDRVLGGGLIPGSVVLVGGEPGIGKSTLLLQVANAIPDKILYVSGEESGEQIKMRAKRLGKINEQAYFLSEILTEQIIQHSKNIQPRLLIVDSVQTLRTEQLDSSPGTVSQIRECTSLLLQYAKQNNIPILLVGHITKEGSLAGPKVLEHIVDTVLQFEGDNSFNYRILRAHKNRFGSISEIGIFSMQSDGLHEVNNPSELLLSHHNQNYSGIATCATIEGIRPLLIEVQALVSTAVYGTPQRSTTGFEVRRLNMLLAVLEKRVGFKLSAKDVFLNIAGGIKVSDPAIDLSVISAIFSSNLDCPISKEICFVGEIGLSGEIRPASRLQQRIDEADKLGYKKIIIPKQKKTISQKNKIQIIEAEKIEKVFTLLFKDGQ